jgi:hypothetical protein
MELPLLVFASVFSVMSFLIAILAMIEVRAMQKSTHSVQYVPLDPPKDVARDQNGFEVISEKTKQAMGSGDDEYLI